MWQNLAPFGGRPISGTVEALLTKVVNQRLSVLPIVVFFVAPAAPLLLACYGSIITQSNGAESIILSASSAETVMLPAHAESIILSAGGAERIILSAPPAESMILSGPPAESMILSVPPADATCKHLCTAHQQCIVP